MNANSIFLPIKREVWEYKGSFVGIFMALGGLVLVLAVFGMSKVSFDPQSIHFQIEGKNFEHDSFSGDEISQPLNYIVEVTLLNLTASMLHIFVLISVFVTFFYLLGALFDDRKDRSVLFWKSMPVSELQVVLTKFFTGLFTVPLIAAAIGLVTAFLLMLVFASWLPFVIDIGFFDTLGKVRIVNGLAMIVLFIIATGVWLSPFCAWIMLASAFAKKSPLAWTIAPPLLLIFSEKILMGRSTLQQLLVAYMPNLSLLENVDDHLGLEAVLALTKSMLLGPEVYVGMLVAALFLGLCVWLRNNRYEI